MNCPICGEPMEYKGVEDGAGDYGGGVADTWYCEGCNEYAEGAVFGDIDGDWSGDEQDEPATFFVDVSSALPSDEDTIEYKPIAPASDDEIPF